MHDLQAQNHSLFQLIICFIQLQSLNHRLFIRKLETDSFVFFSSRFILQEYADSSNQRDLFLLGSLALRIRPIKSVEYA